mgnify:CR=1 FL=1
MAHLVLGIDEVGRGCLAGPVTVAVVALPRNFKLKNFTRLLADRNFKLRDSKKLTPNQREKIFKIIGDNPKILHTRANVYPKTIDRINISQAANLAATRAVKKLISRFRAPARHLKALLDGGLYLNESVGKLIGGTRTIIRGDEKFNSIKLASIIAKVSRDRIMKRNHGKFPQYSFNLHKGYGTKIHIAALKRHGPSLIHRLTFIKNFCKI